MWRGVWTEIWVGGQTGRQTDGKMDRLIYGCINSGIMTDKQDNFVLKEMGN